MGNQYKDGAAHSVQGGDVYFDITDIVHFAMRESRVSGIQRVQTRIVDHFAEVNPRQSFVLFQHPASGNVVVTPAQGLFGAEEFDSNRFLAALGLLHRRRLPRKRDIVARLRGTRPSRGRIYLEQLKVYARSILMPTRMSRMGLLLDPQLWHIARRPLSPLAIRPAPATLVFLGTNWSFDHLHTFATEAREQGWQVLQLVHDLIPALYPQFCARPAQDAFNQFLERSLGFVSHYLSVSDHTRDDLQAYLDRAGSQASISVMPLAHEFGGYPRQMPTTPPPAAGPKDYLLFVGTLDRRKNIENILAAWRLLIGRMGPRAPRIVLAGRPGWDSAAFMDTLEADLELQAKVELVPGPADAELARLYSGCRHVLLPSFAEGWGLPIGEAAWFGRTSIATRSTSLPQVCPQSTIFLDSASAEDIAATVQSLWESTDVLQAKLEALAQTRLRSWKDVAVRLHGITAGGPDTGRPQP